MRSDRSGYRKTGFRSVAVFVATAWLLSGTVETLLAAGDVRSKTESLHEQIDRLVAAGTPQYVRLAAPNTSDGEFLRRVTLDLAGTIPTATAARGFLADRAADKRTKLIDRLLTSPEHARHMQRMFDVLLMRRLPGRVVKASQWQEFLRQSFAENKPWNQITREILSADGADPKRRGPARFYLDRGGDVNTITRDIGRIFLGADLECAQCHNHPEIDDYHQADYYGISAFLVRSFVFTDKKQRKKIFAEKAVGEVSFLSVFDVRDKKATKPTSTAPRMLDGPLIAEPAYSKKTEYLVKPKKGRRPVPRFSRRALLADAIVGAPNERFARTAVNRLWAQMMGRGLIDPIDRDHSDNPPSHPDLLVVLTRAFIAHGYDIRWFQRELALSQTYQRSSRKTPTSKTPSDVDVSRLTQAILKPLSPSQFASAVLQATGTTDVLRKRLGKKANDATITKGLASYEIRFVRLFGGEPGKPPIDFESHIDQVLYLSNDPQFLGLLRPKKGNLAGRMLAISDKNPQAVAQELFLSALTRPPSSQEVRDVKEYLTGRTGKARQAAVQELIWSLVTSAEFRFNH